LGCPDGVRAFVCGIMPVGRAADEILDLAGEIGAGLVVIGSRGLGPVGRIALGSVSTKVAHAAKGPVLVHPPLRGET
jgi:nucleotide-binding universal stress UspA family protein